MRNPTYLLRSKEGIYYFRLRLPIGLRSMYPRLPSEVRRSLKTRDHRSALDHARRLWCAMSGSFSELEKAGRQKTESPFAAGEPKDEVENGVKQRWRMYMRGASRIFFADPLGGHDGEEKTRQLAEALAAYIPPQQAAEKKNEKAGKDELLSKAVNGYLAFKRNSLRAGSFTQYEQAMRLFAEANGLETSTVRVSELSADHIAKGRDLMLSKNKNRALRTNRTLGNVIGNFVKWLDNEGRGGSTISDGAVGGISA